MPVTNDLSVNSAHDLFSAFMLGVVRRIKKIGGVYSHRSLPWTLTHGMSSRPGSRQVWSNTIIDQLATAIQTSGLVTGAAEAYMFIVPAFAAHNLLPEIGPLDLKPTRKADSPEPPSESSCRRVGGAGPYGDRIYNGFDLSSCELEISRWLGVLFPSNNYVKVMDFIFAPDSRPSTMTKDEEIASTCNKTRAAMYLLRSYATQLGRTPGKHRKTARRFSEAVTGLEEACERMGLLTTLVKEDQLPNIYPNLISDIQRIIAENAPVADDQ